MTSGKSRIVTRHLSLTITCHQKKPGHTNAPGLFSCYKPKGLAAALLVPKGVGGAALLGLSPAGIAHWA